MAAVLGSAHRPNPKKKGVPPWLTGADDLACLAQISGGTHAAPNGHPCPFLATAIRGGPSCILHPFSQPGSPHVSNGYQLLNSSGNLFSIHKMSSRELSSNDAANHRIVWIPAQVLRRDIPTELASVMGHVALREACSTLSAL